MKIETAAAALVELRRVKRTEGFRRAVARIAKSLGISSDDMIDLQFKPEIVAAADAIEKAADIVAQKGRAPQKPGTAAPSAPTARPMTAPELKGAIVARVVELFDSGRGRLIDCVTISQLEQRAEWAALAHALNRQVFPREIQEVAANTIQRRSEIEHDRRRLSLLLGRDVSTPQAAFYHDAGLQTDAKTAYSRLSPQEVVERVWPKWSRSGFSREELLAMVRAARGMSKSAHPTLVELVERRMASSSAHESAQAIAREYPALCEGVDVRELAMAGFQRHRESQVQERRPL